MHASDGAEVGKMNSEDAVSVKVVEKLARKALIKRGIAATEYFEYCNEVGCEIWDKLKSIKAAIGEPICMWLPSSFIKPGTSTYVQGVEVDESYNGEIPQGLEMIELPAGFVESHFATKISVMP